MINKIQFIDFFKYLYANNKLQYIEKDLSLLYNFINGKIEKKEIIEEIEKIIFENILKEYKDEGGNAEGFYNQHKKLLNSDNKKTIVFLKTFQLNNLKELKKKTKYPDIFYSEELRKTILIEQNSKCFLCGKDISNLWPHLHHVDYEKTNCERKNLVFLCSRCHGKTNSNRKFWKKYLTEK